MREAERRAVRELPDRLVDQEVTLPELRDDTGRTGRDEHPMLDPSLAHRAEHITGLYRVTDRDNRGEQPAGGWVERPGVETAGDEIPRVLGDPLQRAPYAVEDPAQEARAKRDRQRLSAKEHGLAQGQPGGLLVHLERRDLAIDPNHLGE